ncbi:DUF3027 domain-containing protein [Microbacterium sp. SA39]|uniref:DUF3027 domain-containing protein n=1 Tax=Microbacterium sp. SA39 TaxID=1263625 RepID=UPI0005FA5B14|nr:DUF3027 domain-containing protein [Microbacterium sp. SA39]KJQ55293.1 hypothetical protein RS85_00807 [Microbacterium sp. SA39]
MTSKPDADARLVDAHDLALDALREITPATSIGPAAGYLLEDDGSVSLRFENRLPGYPGWFWTATVARVEDEEPTVLEVELIPGDGALLAPEWVPWAERLAEYRSHQAELAERAAAEGVESVEGADADEDDADLDDDELEDDDLDDDELDDDDDDAELGTVLHAGDVDGVDIDELDPSVSHEDAVDDDTDEDDDESEHDESDDDAVDSDDEE